MIHLDQEQCGSRRDALTGGVESYLGNITVWGRSGGTKSRKNMYVYVHTCVYVCTCVCVHDHTGTCMCMFT